ncbi:MAG: DUF4974 domain-containing protein [Bacteroidales bacterium]|nr:DUF4974 domain-containing protein [Bacteroidales bacterium]
MTTQDNRKIDRDDAELWLSAVSPEALSKYDTDKAFRHFIERKREAESTSWRKTLRWAVSVAAAVILVFGVSYFSFRSGRTAVESYFSEIVLHSPLGSVSTMTLPDGTTVNLNAGSTIRYSQGYGITDRVLSIEGEGFFEVARNEDLPFRISSPSLSVEVLGTKFNFKDYPEDGEASVFLKEGKVSLENLVTEGEKLLMSPGQTVILSKSEGIMRLDESIGESVSGWNDGSLIFEDAPLAEIVKILSRSYNADVVITDPSLSALRFNGVFSREGQSLRDILDILSATGRFTFSSDGGTIEIH